MAPPPANDGTRKVLGDIGNHLNGPRSMAEAAWKPLKPAQQQRQQPVDLTVTESDDDMHVDDPQSVKEYVREIHTLLCQDNFLRPRPEYMDAQQEINAKMRAILIDWIVQVHMKYCLRTETLFLTVQLLDRFLSRKQVPRKQLQLVGATALLIASKYEDVYPPEISQLVYISDSACTRDEIVLCELVMLKDCNGRALDRVTKQKHRPNRKNCPENVRKLCVFRPLWRTISGHFSDIFSDIFRTFFRTFPFSGLSNDLPARHAQGVGFQDLPADPGGLPEAIQQSQQM